MNCTNLFFSDVDDVSSGDVDDVSSDVAALAVQVIPTLGTVLVSLTWQVVPRGAPPMSAFGEKLIGLFFAAAASAQCFALWRFVELLGCSDVVDDAAGWGVAAVAASALSNLAIFVGIGGKRPRTAACLLFGIAAGCLFGEWALRGGLIVDSSASILTSIQQTQCILCVLQTNRIPGRSSAKIRSAPFPVRPVDATHSSSRPSAHVTPCKPSGATWFW